VLKRFSANPNRHLISLLATYEIFGHVHLIFDWADADLSSYWEQILCNPVPGLRTTRWVARQCLGISSGIVEIQRQLTDKNRWNEHDESDDEMKGRQGMETLFQHHGDIKPRNILWFKNGPDPEGMGILVITNFGRAEIKWDNSRPATNPSLIFSPTYCAPERHIPGASIGRSCDIWSLGCVYLEFLTWLLGGWNLVSEFAIARQTTEPAVLNGKLDRFFQLEVGDDDVITRAKVKSEVTQARQPL